MTAVTCRDRGPDKAGPSSIFICGGELEKVLGYFHKNMRFGIQGCDISGNSDLAIGWGPYDYSRIPGSPQINPGKRGLRRSSVRQSHTADGIFHKVWGERLRNLTSPEV
ncbi:MAG TPA: hypothetical protein VMW38_16725 [Terriglobia bacterium]|nr:hypothetical protein [Terriglobia bacterium]